MAGKGAGAGLLRDVPRMLDITRAVVNAVLGPDRAALIDLCGEWEAMSKRYGPGRNCFWKRIQEDDDWAQWGKTCKLRIPGSAELQGVGEAGLSRPWACWWDCSQRPLAHVFEGSVWYRRTVRIPEGWRGKRVWLKIGGVSEQAWFWVNDVQVAWHESYCGTYKYEITDIVRPGESAKIVIEVSNAVGSRLGGTNSRNRWCGVMRALELEATPQVFMDDVWVRGDFDSRKAEVKVEVDGWEKVKVAGEGEQRNGSFSLKATVEGETTEIDIHSSPSDFTLEVPLRHFRPWSPEQPNLYTAKVDLVSGDGTVLQTWRERFGVRKFEVRGRDFYLNGRPFFVRGAGYHNVQPIWENDRIGDRDWRRTEVRRMRSAGFNFLRTHTRCETPEFFDACDELGMMVQAELPYYNDIPCQNFPFDPIRDARELCEHRRRHPSFAVYSGGNEGTFGPALAKRLYRTIREMDPDRLVVEQDNDCWGTLTQTPQIAGRHCAPGTSDFVGGPVNVWPRGSITSDRPVVCHEYLNLCVKANAALESQYTGIWQVPYSRATRKAFLERSGLAMRWDEPLQLSQHALQAHWFKRGIEAARLDPVCDGYLYWSLQDCSSPMGENASSQGLFDPFWGDKPAGHTAASVAVFNSPDCVLCDIFPASCIAEAGETVSNVVSFAHYGDAAHDGDRLTWNLVAPDGTVLVSGGGDIAALPPGGVRKVGEAVFAVPEIDASMRARFTASVGAVTNAWDMWLFPRRNVREATGVWIAPSLEKALAGRYRNLSPREKARVAVVPYGSPETAAARRDGMSVIEIGPAKGEPGGRLGWWWFGKQVGGAFMAHPSLKNLPHVGRIDPLFFRILRDGLQLPQAAWPDGALVGVTEGSKECALHLACREGSGRRDMLVYGLDVLADLPEAKALLDGMIDYCLSPAHLCRAR